MSCMLAMACDTVRVNATNPARILIPQAIDDTEKGRRTEGQFERRDSAVVVQRIAAQDNKRASQSEGTAIIFAALLSGIVLTATGGGDMSATPFDQFT